MVMIHAKKGGNYGVNIFDDGRTMWQSLSCPRDRTIHTTILPKADVAKLTDAFVKADFMHEPECVPEVADVAILVLGFWDGHSKKVQYTSNGYESVLPRLVDEMAGTRQWLK
ncbi:MAG TPA: hypothetical protein VGL81_20150 [Polyangiaceae bacterium]